MQVIDDFNSYMDDQSDHQNGSIYESQGSRHNLDVLSDDDSIVDVRVTNMQINPENELLKQLGGIVIDHDENIPEEQAQELRQKILQALVREKLL